MDDLLTSRPSHAEAEPQNRMGEAKTVLSAVMLEQRLAEARSQFQDLGQRIAEYERQLRELRSLQPSTPPLSESPPNQHRHLGPRRKRVRVASNPEKHRRHRRRKLLQRVSGVLPILFFLGALAAVIWFAAWMTTLRNP